jgi:hypothetical protein
MTAPTSNLDRTSHSLLPYMDPSPEHWSCLANGPVGLCIYGFGCARTGYRKQQIDVRICGRTSGHAVDRETDVGGIGLPRRINPEGQRGCCRHPLFLGNYLQMHLAQLWMDGLPVSASRKVYAWPYRTTHLAVLVRDLG